VTAFGGALRDPTAVMGSRIAAYIVDGLIATVIIFGALWVVDIGSIDPVDMGTPTAAQSMCQDLNATAPGETAQQVCVPIGSRTYVVTEDDVAGIYGRMLAVSLLVAGLNQIVLPATTGGSLGKLLFGLRVVTASGHRAGLGRNLVRYLLLIVDAACCGIPGLVIANRSLGHRRLGDMAAGTFVVHRSAEGRLLHIPGLQVVRGRDDSSAWGADPYLSGHGAGSAGIDQPVWDPRRGAYLRYDQASGLWHAWDDTTSQWLPVSD